MSPPRDQHPQHHQQQQQQQQHLQQHSGGIIAGHGILGGLSGALSVTAMNNASSNIGVSSQPHQHIIMTSRPGSTGHLTPTPGKYQ